MDTELLQKISQLVPEPIREHWVLVDNTRYPVKQVHQAMTGLPRSSFTSHQAIASLKKFGFEASEYHSGNTRSTFAVSTNNVDGVVVGGLAASFKTLVRFLSDQGLTDHLAGAESAFEHAGASKCSEIAIEYGFDEDLLDAALAVRARVGRLSDVIHAATIARVLPQILEPGEVVSKRPSLGAGNDASRPYDLETNLRIAEFKVAQWKGADTMRKRGLVADMVHLALDEGDRRAQMFVVGPRPVKFLKTAGSTVEWALGRSSPHTRLKFEASFGPAGNHTISEFMAGPAGHIEVVDLSSYIPSLTLPEEAL